MLSTEERPSIGLPVKETSQQTRVQTPVLAQSQSQVNPQMTPQAQPLRAQPQILVYMQAQPPRPQTMPQVTQACGSQTTASITIPLASDTGSSTSGEKADSRSTYRGGQAILSGPRR